MNYNAILLAGGKSSRMGEDKASLNYKGKPFIQYVIDAVKPLVKEVIIVGNGAHLTKYSDNVVKDLYFEKGPLAGIISGLNASDENLNIVLSCDIPNITTEVLEKLIKVNLKNIEVALLESSEGKMPLIAIHKKENIKHYKACISQGKTGVFKAISTLRVKNIKVSELEKDSLKNINTKQEFLELCK